MSLDLSSDVIEHAYQSLLHPSQKDQDVEDAIHDFILLEYDPNPKASQKDGQNSNGTAAFRSSLSSQQSLRLAKLGSNGIDQLRPMFKPGEILFALIRIQRKILIIQYFSEVISGVKRARALVHGRAVVGHFKAASANVVIARQEDLTEHLIRSSLKLDKSLPITSEAERERERQERLSVAWPTSSSARSSFLGGNPDPNGTATPKAVSPITPPKDRFEAGSSPSAAVDQSARKDSPALRDINAQNASPASGTGSSILNTSPAGYSSSRPRIQGLGLGLNLSSSSKFTNGDQNVDHNVEVNEAKAASSKNGSGETTKSSQEISRWSLTTSSSPGAEEDVTASIMRRNEALNVLPTGLTAAGTSNLSLASSSKDNATPSASSPNPAQSNVNSKSQTPKTPKTPKSTQTARSRANSSSNGPPGPPPIGLPLPPLPPLPNDRTSPKTTGPPGLPLPPLPPNAQHQPPPNKAIPPPPPADEEEAARLEKEKEEFLAFQRNEALRSEAVDRERQRRRELELIKRDEAKRAEVMKRLAEEQEKEIGKRSAKASAPPVIKKDLNGERSRASSGPPPTSNGHAKGVSETDTARIRTLSHQVRGERGTASESISRIASPSHTLPPSTASPPPVTRSRRQKDDDEGESWLQRHTRKQSEERVLGGMYSKVQPEKDLPTAPYVASKSSGGRNQSSGSGGGVISDSDERLAEQAAAHAADARRRAEQMALAQIERARAEQRSLEFQLSEVERRNRERNEAEAAARARWVRQQAERERLDAFERSKLESAERLRREAVEKRNREEAHSAEETRKEKAKKALEEKEAVEQAQRRRKDAEEREHRLKIEVARRKEREEEVRQREEKKRLQRQSLMNKFESRTYDQTVVLSGSVTVQKSDATIWRRRFYELRGSDLSLSKSESEKSIILDTIQLRGLVRSLEDNPEDSQMLNSFSLGFLRPDSEEPETILLATDSHEEKELLLCAIGVLSKAQV